MANSTSAAFDNVAPVHPQIALPSPTRIQKLVGDALREDLATDSDFTQFEPGECDISAGLLDADAMLCARLVCREAAVLCGSAWFAQAFQQVDANTRIDWRGGEGEWLVADAVVCEVSGRARAVVTAERTALNLLQTLSGTATIARQYAEAVAHTSARILDTRKTIPGLRYAQKYAVRVGGAHNHRLGLFDQILVKENHIVAAGGIAAAVKLARALNKANVEFEIEVESLAQLREALAAGARRILLDNFALPQLRRAVELSRGRAQLEVSGNVTLRNVGKIAETGVNYISVGALTKHIRAVDFSLRAVDG